jgi:ABC-2 type transport system ATP-binding protein
MTVNGLVCAGLRKQFGQLTALGGLDLEVPRGELVGFLGPNGAGKSTTMRSILGLLALDGGTITWNGQRISADDRRNIGYMPQERGLYPRMRVGEHIAYIGRLAGLDASVADDRAHHWADHVGLADRFDDLIQDLSTGNQQRVQLAVSMVHEPELMVLDEPFAGLDPVAVATLSNVMLAQVEKGTTVVFSSHQLELVQDLASSLTIVANGTTRAVGSTSELRRRAPHRLLRVEWAGDVADWPDWIPNVGTPRQAPPGVTLIEVPANADSAALVAAAATAGPFVSVSYEPPSLEEIFIDIVGAA